MDRARRYAAACHHSSRCSPCSRSAAGRPRSRTSESRWRSTPGSRPRSHAAPSRRPPRSGRRTASPIVQLQSVVHPRAARLDRSTRRSPSAWPSQARTRREPGRVRSPRFAFWPTGSPSRRFFCTTTRVIKLGLGTISLGGTREPQWPRAVRDRVLGRMIGRVVAHEIGHWLLRSRDHSTSGLMRAHQTTDALADPGRAGFALAPADFARLRAALAR